MDRPSARHAPDIVHVTGPSECGLLGAWVAHELGVPLAASWHTNVHEYAAKRSRWLLDRLPARQRAPLSQHIEDAALQLACVFYRWARVLFAPNLELCSLLEQRTDRRCHLMQRGVDTQAFSPAFRDRDPTDTDFVLGFVGRMSIEKNVALLVRVQQELEARGLCNFHFRAPMPAWTSSSFLRTPILSATWCWKRWLPGCPRS
jgi:glycosyltransferase involved in cell wall biosynthesis